MAEQTTKYRLAESLRKRDKYGAEIKPGDVCIWSSKGGLVPVIYIEKTRGNGNTGKFGRFYTPEGKHSLMYSSVIFAFDPLGKRKNNSKSIKQLIRKFYEGLV